MKKKVRSDGEKFMTALARDLSDLVQFSSDAIIGKTLQGKVTSWNPGAEILFGYSAKEMIGKNLKCLIPRARQKEEIMILKEIMRGKSVSRIETIRLRKDGTQIDVSITVSPLKDRNGKIVGAFKVARDITDRKKNEERLRLLGGALEVAANAIVITDSQGVIEWVNTAFTTFSGYEMDEAIGRKTGELLKSGRHDPSFYRTLWKTISSGNVWHGEIINRRKDNSFYTEDMTITPLKDSKGKITNYIAVKIDITQKKKNEWQILRTQRMESIGTLAGGIAHDLNNILMPIMMCADTLQLKIKDKQQRDIISTISHSATRGAEMVSQVLSFARGVEGQQINVHPIHLIKDIEKIIQETFPKSIQLQIEMESGLWTLLGDPTQLQQVLLNLCVNARDAMLSGGSLTIRAKNVVLTSQGDSPHLESSEGPHLCIQIEDTGTGIPSAVMDNIFDPFFTTKEIGKGSGLGLSTSMGIIKSHHGFIRVESDYGKGSRFSVYLPAKKQKGIPDRKAIASARHRGKGELILLVDDEFSIRQSIQHTLKTFGYRVILASNGAEAIDTFQKNCKKIDVIIMDMLMPVMGGSETIQKLAKIDPKIAIVASSGVSFSGSSSQVTKHVKAFLPKPYNSLLLLQTLKNVLKNTGKNPKT